MLRRCYKRPTKEVNLKREFENLKMQDSEGVRTTVLRVYDVVNKMALLEKGWRKRLLSRWC